DEPSREERRGRGQRRSRRFPGHLFGARSGLDLADLLLKRLAESLARAALEPVEATAEPRDDLVELLLSARTTEALDARCQRDPDDRGKRPERAEHRQRLAAHKISRIGVVTDARQ